MAARTKDLDRTIKAAKPLIYRSAAFLVLCIIYSGIIGPRIINRGYVDKDGFWIYGWAGKAGLYGALVLSMLIWRKGSIVLSSWKASKCLPWGTLSLLAVIIAWVSVGKIVSGNTAAVWPITANLMMVGSVIFAAGGTFGPANIRKIARAYKYEILLALGLSIVFGAFLALVYGLWSQLSSIVLHVVRKMLQIIGLSVSVIAPRTLKLSKFSIEISKYCSGVDSIALFTGLYSVVGILDWKRLIKSRYFGIFPLALLILMACNILRVFVLIVAGYYISPEIAFNLFHTYAGMVFFIIYSAIFWGISYKWMVKPHKSPK